MAREAAGAGAARSEAGRLAAALEHERGRARKIEGDAAALATEVRRVC